MKLTVACLTLAGVVSAAHSAQGQDPATPETHFAAGRYAESIEAAQQNATAPEMIFLTGRSYLRLNRPDDARMQFAQLSAGVEVPTAWSLVGESANALIDTNTALAIEKASHAVVLGPEQFHPHYQLGLAYSTAEQWEPAAAALEKATSIDPAHAYAHYFAGLTYSRLRQLDRMAAHLEYFLKLAPHAPERPAVMSLMRSVRGL